MDMHAALAYSWFAIGQLIGVGVALSYAQYRPAETLASAVAASAVAVLLGAWVWSATPPGSEWIGAMASLVAAVIGAAAGSTLIVLVHAALAAFRHPVDPEDDGSVQRS